MEQVFLSKEIKKILEKIDLTRLKGRVGIKVHFGEKGCVTYINPEIVKTIYNYLKEKGFDVYLIECNVLYKGSRTNATNHLKTAKEHGFDFAKIDILDGELGNEYIEEKIKGNHFNFIKIGKGYEKYNSIIVLSHFKGHAFAGYGGALKNIGMGLGSRAGKLEMHATVSPAVNSSQCIGCQKCIQGCNFEAIDLIDGKAVINKEKCVGCAMCVAVCPTGAVQIPWGTCTGEELQERICEYSLGMIQKIGKENIIYINVLEKITKDCDCYGVVQEPLTKDIGIVLGNNIVSIDKASLDLVNKQTEKFEQANITQNSHFTGYAEKLGLGKQEYELINLD